MRRLLFLFTALFALLAALWRWARNRALAFEDRDVLDTPAPGRRIQVEGVWLHYVERGAGDAVVLIHGLGASTYTWRRNLDELGRSFRVVALDLLGFGYSQRIAEADYSLTAHARRVALLMDALRIGEAVLVGHSLGGAVAQRFAALYPERVRRLVLVNSATQREVRLLARTRWLRAVNPFYYAFVYHSRRMRRRLFAMLYYDRRVPDDVVEHYLAMARFRGHEEALSRLARDVAHDQPLLPQELRAPALVIWGERDRLVAGSRGRWLVARLPEARLVVVPRAAHMTPEEQPEIVDREIAAFAARGAPEEVTA